MIVLPRRSVTRFFVPLIDVLILLFCIFLLMPFVKSEGEGGESGSALPAPESPVGDAKELAQQVERLRADVERLRRERGEIVQKLVVRPLEIDKDTGGLFYFEGAERVEIRDAAEATQLIERDRRDAMRKGSQEIYYLFLLPRGESSYPTDRQMQSYKAWFNDVPHNLRPQPLP